MLLLGERKFLKTPFVNENELEQVVMANYEYIFGSSSLYLPRAKIVTADGSGTIPDGFVVDIEKHIWFIVEAELLQHNVYVHIVPQITKQINAASQPDTRQKIEETIIEQYNCDQTTRDKFDEAGIIPVNVRKVVGDILRTLPIVGMPIDGINDALKDYSTTIKNGMKIWIVSKFVELGCPTNIIYEFPEEYSPVIDTDEITNDAEWAEHVRAQYNVNLVDLVNEGLLKPSETLYMNFKPKNGKMKKYEATVLDDGSLSFLNQIFGSPSNAAIAGIQDAGSERKTSNGWVTWKTKDGKTLAELRNDYTDIQSKKGEQ
jgi:hypothetical protein